jgi:hypothetical protein
MSGKSQQAKEPPVIAIEESKAQLLKWAKDATRSVAELSDACGRFPEVDRAIASHPSASGELLAKLSHSKDKATRARVAANPATPPADLVRLGQQFPKEFLENPALDLLMLENPALLENIPQALLVRLLKSDRCPADFVVWAARHAEEKVQLAVAMNAAAPPQALDALSQSRHASARESASARMYLHPNALLDPELAFVSAVKRRLESVCPTDAIQAWRKGDIGLPQYTSLAVGARLAVAGVNLQALAFTAHLPISVQRLLAVDSDRRVRQALAGSPFTAPNFLRRLSREQHRWLPFEGACVRAAVGANPKASEEMLTALAQDEDSMVRGAVASNLHTPPELLKALSADQEQSVRPSAYGTLWRQMISPSIPPLTLETWSRDPEASVRRSAASNPVTSPVVLQTLSADPEKSVRVAVAGNSGTPPLVRDLLLGALAEDTESWVWRSVIRNPFTPPLVRERLLEVLSKEPESWVRAEVAENPGTSPQVLRLLSKDCDCDVRMKVAGNPNTPPDVLELLSRDTEQVQCRVAANPRTPERIAETLLREYGYQVSNDPCASALALRILSAHRDGNVRGYVASNPSTPADVLYVLSKDRCASVRIAVAAHTSTPVHVLEDWSKRSLSVQLRAAVAGNPSTPPDVLTSLASDCPHEVVWASMLKNPAIEPEFAGRLAGLLFDEVNPQASPNYRRLLAKATAEVRTACEIGNLLHRCGKDPNKSVLARRPLAALMALCDSDSFIEPSRIAKVAASTDWLIRAAVARNPATPPNLLKKLSGDAHPLVSALAIRAHQPMADGHDAGQTLARTDAASPSRQRSPL